MSARTIGLAAAALIITAIVAIAVSAGPSQPAGQSAGSTAAASHGTGAATPRQTEGPATSAATSAATPTATPAPTTFANCQEEPGDLSAGLSKPACPSAILAVELAVAPVRLPINRVVIQPGPFFCNGFWPGMQSAAVCAGIAVRPGQFMHAWVSFVGSPKIAVVVLGLDLSDADGRPSPTRPPWHTTLLTVEIPPTGWVMP